MTRTQRLAGCPRAGFTIIEILVVIAIIGLLAALAASGVFQYMEAQKQANTETNLRAADQVLRMHIDAVLTAADKEPLPASVIALATNNGTVLDPQQKRARVIWRTLRLVQEFPMSYAEARNPVSAIAASPVYKGLINDLPPKKTYLNALKTAKGGGAVEAATLLLLALQQGRGGMITSAEDLRSGAADTNGDGLKELVDGWGNPVVFYRFPTGNTELDGTKPPSLKCRNPLDPEGVLMHPLWNNAMTVANPAAGAYWFKKLCHGVETCTYAPPVIASSGRDGKFGLNNELFGPTPLADMSPSAGAAAQAANDNIYSFRLRLGARGD